MLYRSILKESGKLANYNFREHARRRASAEFRKNKLLSSVEASDRYLFGANQLAVLKRQAVISTMFEETTSSDTLHKLHD